RKLGCKCHCALLCASIDRRAATVAPFWDRGTKEKVSAARRAPRDFCLRADGMECRLGSGEHESPRRADRRRLSVHPQRRKTLVHESDQGRRACGNGAHAVENGRRPRAQTDHRVHCRCRFARTRDYIPVSFHGFARALQRHREVHRCPRAARKHDRKGRSGIEGRGYETADSLAGRGEEPVAVERLLRDCRINMIFEGSSEIMRLFIAREALDPHLKVGGAIFNTQLPMSDRAKAVFSSGKFYAGWYPRQWMPNGAGKIDNLHETLHGHVNDPALTSKRLARGLFHAMARFGPKLDREQLLLSRFVGIATELFAISA